MATLENVITLKDRVSDRLKKMSRATNILNNKMRGFNASLNKISDTNPKLNFLANGIGRIGSLLSTVKGKAKSFINALNPTAGIKSFLGSIGKNVAPRAPSPNIQQTQPSMTKSIIGGNLAAEGIKYIVSKTHDAIAGMVNYSDQVANTNARLRSLVASSEDLDNLNKYIYKSAKDSKGEYDALKDAVAQIGVNAKGLFQPKELVDFTAGVQKLFKIGGTGAEAAKGSMLQLTQALGSGVLQGDELHSIMEGAPLIGEMIAKQMGVARGQLKQLGAEGKITSEIVKSAILNNLAEIDEKFKRMPTTFGDVMNLLKSDFEKALEPASKKLTSIFGSDQFATVLNEIQYLCTGVLVPVISLIVDGFKGLIDSVSEFVTFLKSGTTEANIALYGILSVLGLLGIALASQVIAWGINAGAMAIHAAAALASSVATGVMTVAQEGLNAALYACPISWIVGAILLCIVAVYLVVDAFNQWTGATISTTGLIFGYFAWMFAMIYNRAIGFINGIIAIANFLGSVFISPVDAIRNLFIDLWNDLLDDAASFLDGLIGILKKVPIFASKLGDVNVKASLGNFKGKRTAIDGYNPIKAWDRVDATAWADTGYKRGAGLETGVKDAFNMDNFKNKLKDLGTIKGVDIGNTKPNPALNDLAKNGKKTADNTGKIKDALDVTENDLKYLKELAEIEAINKYTQGTINIEVGGLHVEDNGERNFDGMLEDLRETLVDAVKTGTEGVSDI